MPPEPGERQPRPPRAAGRRSRPGAGDPTRQRNDSRVRGSAAGRREASLQPRPKAGEAQPRRAGRGSGRPNGQPLAPPGRHRGGWRSPSIPGRRAGQPHDGRLHRAAPAGRPAFRRPNVPSAAHGHQSGRPFRRAPPGPARPAHAVPRGRPPSRACCCPDRSAGRPAPARRAGAGRLRHQAPWPAPTGRPKTRRPGHPDAHGSPQARGRGGCSQEPRRARPGLRWSARSPPSGCRSCSATGRSGRKPRSGLSASRGHGARNQARGSKHASTSTTRSTSSSLMTGDMGRLSTSAASCSASGNCWPA